MTSPELENLVEVGTLKREPCSRREFQGLLASGAARLADAANASLALESRFDLAYNAAHALALAALRSRGYRSENRYVVFQVLPHTSGLRDVTWRVLAKAHERRNLAGTELYAGLSARPGTQRCVLSVVFRAPFSPSFSVAFSSVSDRVSLLMAYA
jgi:hypothetical protein